ncbi:MAG TPA: type II secretion system protein [Atribacterota bacterium]|nr:type II secretion system protein [Atribacterota bacterium]
MVADNNSNKNYIIRSNNGYTLLELIVVISIISALLLMSFKGLLIIKQNYDLNVAAHQLEATLKDCQGRAMYTGGYYKIDFYPSLNRYRVYHESVLIEDVQLEDINLHYTNFTDNKVYFYKTGTPSMGGTVTLKTKSGRTLYVIMTPVTARTRVSTKPPDNW